MNHDQILETIASFIIMSFFFTTTLFVMTLILQYV